MIRTVNLLISHYLYTDDLAHNLLVNRNRKFFTFRLVLVKEYINGSRREGPVNNQTDFLITILRSVRISVFYCYLRNASILSIPAKGAHGE